MGYLANRRIGTYPLGTRQGGSSALFSSTGVSYDYALGGEPFLSAIGFQEGLQYRRGFLPQRREQFDNSPDPGEQMLQEQWWYRSQSSFHLGAGIKFQEPAQGPTNAFRFQDSRGVDPWTPGELRMLRTVTSELATVAATPAFVRSCMNGTADAVLVAEDDNLTLVTDIATTPVDAGNVLNKIVGLATDGTTYYARHGTAIFAGALPSGTAISLWTGLSNAETDPDSMAFPIEHVKNRLIVGDLNSLYELVGSAGGVVGAALFAHPNSGWRWTAITAGPNAIYAAGCDAGQDASGQTLGNYGSVYKITVKDDGTLNQPVEVVELPRGEVPLSLYAHQGTLAVGTSLGLRVGRIDAFSTGGAGDIIIEGPRIDTPSPVRSLTARDRFIYAAWTDPAGGTDCGLLRLDISQEIAEGQFPYAQDLRAPTAVGAGSNVSGIATFGNSDRMAFVTLDPTGAGDLYVETPADLVTQGYLLTGNIRYNTLENKIFRYISIRSQGMESGTIAVSIVRPGDSEENLATIDTSLGDSGDLLVSELPLQYAAFRFTFNRDAVALDEGGSMLGYQAKALPWTERITALEVPLLCFDFERDRNGTLKGGKGRALARLDRMEALAATGQPLVFQDLVTKQAYVTIVEEYNFTQFVPPTRNQEGFGGVIEFTLRIVV